MKLVSTLLLLLVTTGSYAQQAPAVAGTTAHADSLQAIHRVFQHQRRWARVCTLGLGVSLSASADVLATGNFTSTRRGLYLVSTGINTGFGLLGARDWHRFSQRQERLAILRFEAHQPQPAYVQQQVSAYLLQARRH